MEYNILHWFRLKLHNMNIKKCYVGLKHNSKVHIDAFHCAKLRNITLIEEEKNIWTCEYSVSAFNVCVFSNTVEILIRKIEWLMSLFTFSHTVLFAFIYKERYWFNTNKLLCDAEINDLLHCLIIVWKEKKVCPVFFLTVKNLNLIAIFVYVFITVNQI